jgi:hypothetical protein
MYTEQSLVIETDDAYNDWIDYQSSELGLYALQQELVEQIIILGELRGDLLKVTDNADADLVEIQNFDISENNKYASASNFYRLISACNTLIIALERNHPEVLEDDPTVSDYHRIYGEALCMRGWAHFNAARIYGSIPYITDELTDYEAIIDYISNPGAEFYVDSCRYVFDTNGLDLVDVSDTVYYPVDTVFVDTVYFETYTQRFVDIYTVVDNITDDLTNRLNYVGVEYGIRDDIDDDSWDAIIWTEYSKDYLLGQMALTIGDINGAYEYLNSILFNTEYYSTGAVDILFGLDDRFADDSWQDIHTGIDVYEHIYTLWFGDSNQQENDLQNLFDNETSNWYYMQPTRKAVHLWETEWIGQSPGSVDLWDESSGTLSELSSTGTPGDYSRGPNVSYVYKRDGEILTNTEIAKMLAYKKAGNETDLDNMMEDVDTLVYKFTIGKNEYDNDHFVILYRAASAHLYGAEICTYSEYINAKGTQKDRTYTAQGYLDGTYNSVSSQLGVRGRVGLEPKYIEYAYNVIHDPFTNEPLSVEEFTVNGVADLTLQREYFEEVVLDERAKELAFEGERFYDIMRVAKRRGDLSFLADMIADAEGKYSEQMKEVIRAKLMDESNWYVPFSVDEN